MQIVRYILNVPINLKKNVFSQNNERKHENLKNLLDYENCCMKLKMLSYL